MDTSNSPTSSPMPPADITGAQAEIASLKVYFQLVLVMLIILTAGLNIFLFRQVAMARRQASEASDYVANYQKTTEPAVARFVSQLQNYARTHPDFAPILAKYATLTPQSGPGGLPLPPAQ